MRGHVIRNLGLLGLALFCAYSVRAQGPATGFPPFGSSDTTQFDGINLQNLNVNFGIPIVSSPGRNMNFALSLVNNSLLWTKNGTVWSPLTDQSGNPTWGWTKDIPGGPLHTGL